MNASSVRRLGRWDVFVFLVVLVVFLFGDALVGGGGVRTSATAYFTLRELAEVLLIALPMTMLIISGEIDLSVGATVGMSGAVMAKAYAAGVPMWLCCVIGVLTGFVAGAFNGWLVTAVGLQSLAVTIGTLALYRGIALVLLGDQPISFAKAKSWVAFGGYGGKGKLWGWMPAVGWIVLVAIIVFVFVLTWTKTGHSIYAIGLNSEAARFSGINVARTKFWLFVVTGAISGVAGVLFTLRNATARPQYGAGMELSVIAAVLFGGVSIFGGVGTLFGVVNAVLFLGLIRRVLLLTKVNQNFSVIVTGLLLLVSVIGPTLAARIRATSFFSRGAIPAPRESRSAQSPVPDPERL